VGISDTNRTDKTGRWHVLVMETTFKSIWKTLTSKIPTWVSNLPAEIIANIPVDFPASKVYQKNDYDGDDDSSSGQASYMSSCAQSYGSFDDTPAAAQYYHPPGRSYASALAGTNYRPPALPEHMKEVLIPTATPSFWISCGS
jgi:hypothetical protein